MTAGDSGSTPAAALPVITPRPLMAEVYPGYDGYVIFDTTHQKGVGFVYSTGSIASPSSEYWCYTSSRPQPPDNFELQHCSAPTTEGAAGPLLLLDANGSVVGYKHVNGDCHALPNQAHTQTTSPSAPTVLTPQATSTTATAFQPQANDHYWKVDSAVSYCTDHRLDGKKSQILYVVRRANGTYIHLRNRKSTAPLNRHTAIKLTTIASIPTGNYYHQSA